MANCNTHCEGSLNFRSTVKLIVSEAASCSPFDVNVHLPCLLHCEEQEIVRNYKSTVMPSAVYG